MAFSKFRKRFAGARSNYRQGRQRRRSRRGSSGRKGILGLPENINIGGLKLPVMGIAILGGLWFFVAPFKAAVMGLFKK